MSLVLLLLFFCFGFVICNGHNGHRTAFLSMQDAVSGHFGLTTEQNDPCLLLKFSVSMYNLNINGTNIKSPMVDLSASNVKLDGFCANPKHRNKHAQLTGKWIENGREKILGLMFTTETIKSPIHQVEEVRWALSTVTYSESYQDSSIDFKTANDSIAISAPQKQRFLCKDRINITLRNSNYKDIVLELEPEIEAQPFGTVSNIFVCERTRRRTLSEAFQNKMTIFSGVVLGLSSVSVLTGYSLRRQLMPERFRQYEAFN
ncbi:hypothetical protein QR680_006122 [Steinernema hermaphroditum]|uniref:Uncharacterized protein n=1 Tax=Steinernema hermaphroditum TaxID=289476 RepID=A0AA39HUC7_9BILA|nr:hypothetical protein QR680_006122 [Steinernema hermaphroditum]